MNGRRDPWGQDPDEDQNGRPGAGMRRRDGSGYPDQEQYPDTPWQPVSPPWERPASGRGRGPADGTVNRDVDLDELDPQGRAAHRGGQRGRGSAGSKRARRRKTIKITAGVLAGLILALAATGTYLYHHLFGNIQTVSLSSLTNRPAAAKADAQGNTPQNILVLGSQTRDGQSGPHLGNSTKLGTNISDTTMLVHISAEKKWAVVVSIPRDLIVPRPQCQGRTDPNATVPASTAAMFDLAMNLGGPACAVATVEQMTGIRLDHFVEVTFNAFQDLTNAVNGVQVCVPEPGINDPNYSGLVLSAGLHTVSGGQALEFIRDRHGVGTGTDLGRIQYQQMFVSSLFTKLTSSGTLSDPVTLYKIANAVTSNLTVDDGLKSLSAMVGLATSVQGLKSHYMQFITAPYIFDPVDQNRVDPGPGFSAVWSDLHADTPLPGSAAAKSFGTTATTAAASPPASASATAVPLSSITAKVYNGTSTPRLATYAAANLKALGVNTTIGYSGYSGYAKTEIYYPAGQQAQAEALANQVAGAVLKQSTNVSTLTLVIGQNAPANLTSAPATSSASAAAAATASISAESRTGDQNICSALPTPVKYGGHP